MLGTRRACCSDGSDEPAEHNELAEPAEHDEDTEPAKHAEDDELNEQAEHAEQAELPGLFELAQPEEHAEHVVSMCWQWMMSPLCVEHDEDAE